MASELKSDNQAHGMLLSECNLINLGIRSVWCVYKYVVAL